MNMVDKFSDMLSFPLPDEVKEAIEEILGEQKAKEELMRIGVLGLMKRKGCEIRLVKTSGESTKPQIMKYEEGDLSALVKLVNENYADYTDFFYEFIPYTEETLRSKLKRRPIVFVAKDRTIEGFIACYEALWGTDINMLCVQRGLNRAKIEDSLVSQVEEEAEGGKVTITLGSDNPRIADFERKGYEIYGGLYHFTRNLDKVPLIPPLPKGATLRSMAKGEEETITEIFYDPDKVGARIFKPGFTKVWKEHWNHIAELNGKIIAIVCSRPKNEFNAYYNAKRAEIWERTLPEYRWKGFEKALMCRALKFLREKGMENVSIVDTETPPEYTNFHISLGFKVKFHWKFLRKYL